MAILQQRDGQWYDTETMKFYPTEAAAKAAAASVATPTGSTSSESASSFVVIYRGGESKTINRDQLRTYLNAGWSASPPSFAAPNANYVTPDFNNLINTDWINSVKQGTLLKDQTGAMAYKGSAGMIFPIADKSELDDLIKQGTVKSADATMYTDSGKGTVSVPAELPDELLNDPAWKFLSEEERTILKITYSSLVSGSDAEKADARQALETAIKYADTDFKTQIRLVQNELQRSIDTTNEDYQSRLTALDNQIQSIREDLTFNRQNLNLDEQAELSKLLKQYEIDKETLQTNMQESGLAFSSPRKVAESRLNTGYQETAVSTRRRYAQEQRNIDLASARNLTELQRQTEDLNRTKRESLTSLSRTAEQMLGTENLLDAPGVSRLGIPVVGTIEKQRQAEVLNLEKSLKNRLS